jgi:hypothetical protein
VAQTHIQSETRFFANRVSFLVAQTHIQTETRFFANRVSFLGLKPTSKLKPGFLPTGFLLGPKVPLHFTQPTGCTFNLLKP